MTVKNYLKVQDCEDLNKHKYSFRSWSCLNGFEFWSLDNVPRNAKVINIFTRKNAKMTSGIEINVDIKLKED